MGLLIAIGGGEDKTGRKSILDRVLDETRRRDPVVEIITAVSTVPDDGGNDYIASFEDLGVDVGTIVLESSSQVNDEKLLKRLERCDVVFFSGGNQRKVTSLVKGTAFLNIIKQRYHNEKNFVVAGTGTGAAAMSSTMIVAGPSQDALIKGELQLTSGLGFIDKIFLDTHFIQAGRFGRLMQTVASNPSILGMGLAEDTGVIIYEGNEMEVMGSGLVAIVDGSSIKYTNLYEIRNGDPITIEGLVLHVLARNTVFLISQRSIVKEKR